MERWVQIRIFLITARAPRKCRTRTTHDRLIALLRIGCAILSKIKRTELSTAPRFAPDGNAKYPDDPKNPENPFQAVQFSQLQLERSLLRDSMSVVTVQSNAEITTSPPHASLQSRPPPRALSLRTSQRSIRRAPSPCGPRCQVRERCFL